MKWIRQNPVRAFTGLVVLLGLLYGGAQREHLLSGRVLAWLGLAVTAGTGLIGWLGVHDVVTPLANPRAADLTPLVPVDDPAAGPRVTQ